MKTLLALGAGSVSLSYWNLLPDGGGIQVALGAQNKTSLEMFRQVSSVVTLRDNLDEKTLVRMYEVFRGEPWAPDHIARVHDKIKAALARGVVSKSRPPMRDEAWKFDKGESWFVGHLLTTWYLGIYYHAERPPQRVAYETALMFDPTRGILPVPFAESTGYGGWTGLPEDGK